MTWIYIDRIAFWKDEDGIFESPKKKDKCSMQVEPIKEIEVKEINHLEFQCGFIAKSKAGHSVHKMKH